MAKNPSLENVSNNVITIIFRCLILISSHNVSQYYFLTHLI